MYNFGEKFGTPTTYTYGYSTGAWGDQLTSFNGASITYDAVGNPLTYYNGSTFGWTGRRLTSATKGGASYTFTYDDGGIRQSKTKDGKTTTYYYDGGKLIAERNNDAAVIYIYDELGRPLGCRVFVFETDATFNAGYYVYDYWYVCNLQGDVVEMLDTNGNTVAIFSYDPYGNITSKAYSKGSPFAAYSNLYYRGYYYDTDLELYYLNSRYYDANTGRFISPDTNEVLTITPLALTDKNLYAYCDNNPVMRTDNGGECWNWLIGAAVGAITSFVVQVAEDIVTSIKNEKLTVSSWQKYTGAVVGGAVGGAILGGTGNQKLASFASGAVTSVATQGLEKLTTDELDDKSWAEVGVTAVGEGLVSLTLSDFIKVKPWNAGRNSMSAVYRSGLTKLRNKTASRMSTKVMGKGLLSSLWGEFPAFVVNAIDNCFRKG